MGFETELSEVNTNRFDLLLISFGYGTSNTILETRLNFPFQSFQQNGGGKYRQQQGNPPGWVSE